MKYRLKSAADTAVHRMHQTFAQRHGDIDLLDGGTLGQQVLSDSRALFVVRYDDVAGLDEAAATETR